VGFLSAVCARDDTRRVLLVLAASATGNGSSSTVAILALVAAIVAAVVGPIVAGVFLLRNTRRTLDAEDRRLRRRLAFERAQTDRTEVRQLLDALADLLYEIDRQTASYEYVSDQVVHRVSDSARPGQAWEEREDRARETLRSISERVEELYRAAINQLERLRLRLGDEGAALVSLAVETYDAGVDSIMLIESMNSFEKLHDHAAALRPTIAEKRSAFTVEALKFTAARLDSEELPNGQRGT
jgi:hypothetical protein